MVDLMVVHVMLAGGGTIIHHQIFILFCSVSLCPILRIAVLHHQDAPSTSRCGVVGQACWLLAHHHRGRKSPPFGRDGGVPHAQVAATAMDAAVHAPLLRATVVVTDAFGGGAP